MSFSKKKTGVLSRREIVSLINDGQAIIIYDQTVLNLTKWLPKHPGGDKAVLHMVGRDATDEMNAYHGDDTIKTFKRWKIGHIDYDWSNLLPPIQGADYSDFKDVGNNNLDDKMDKTSSPDNSEVEFTTSSVSSTDSLVNIKSTTPNKGIGYPKGDVRPKVPQNMIVNDENRDKIYPIVKDTIVDPKRLLENYDNNLCQEDLLGLPSLDYKTQKTLHDEYNELHDTLKRNGFYKCDYWNYVRELIKIGSIMLYSFSFFKLGHYTISGILMGLGWQQMTFIGHDAGHLSITHNFQIDTVFGMTIADWFGGLSLGWWKKNHNVHHLITNDPIHDPDIQHLPFFAVSTRLFGNAYSTYYEKVLWFDKAAQFLIPFQNYLYYPILAFGRFNLYRLSWTYLIMGEGPKKGKAAWLRYYEIAGLSFFAYWYFYLLIYKSFDNNWSRLLFLLVTNIASFIVHVQITLSHFAMSTSDLGVSESFPMRQVRTTMDVDCPEWLDFFHGGLQFQAIHHLFPRLPRHNLRRAQPFVLDFCKKTGLKYSIYGFGEGNEIVISKLADIGKQCGIMLDASKKFDGHDMF